jgi:hypothetical protein
MAADDLYGLPLDRFVPERTVLARGLRADGRREEAAEVAALRKPSVAAWAVNQLVRTQVRALAELFDAGDTLEAAQADVLAGRGDASALRVATERERAAVDALVNAARGLLTSQGHELSAAVIDRVAETLHAAAVEDDARAQVRGGRLERELRHVGLGVGTAAAPPARRGAGRRTPTREQGAKARSGPSRGQQTGTASKGRAERERMAEERAAAQRAERDRAIAHKAARVAQSEAKRRADRATRALQVAEERRERAAQALYNADEALATARAQAEAAADSYRRAQQELEST